MDELELLQHWRSGDAQSGETIIGRHYRSVFLFFARRTDTALAEDLTQQSFETLCQKVGEFRGASTLRTYLFGIARWKLAEHNRRSAKVRRRFETAEHSLDDELAEDSLFSSYVHTFEQRLLVRAIRQLSTAQQAILTLYYFEDLSELKIAQRLGHTRAVVRGDLGRARRSLMRKVEELARAEPYVDRSVSSLHTCLRKIRGDLRPIEDVG